MYVGVSTRTPYPIPCSTVCLISHSFMLRRERNEGETCGMKGKTPAGGRGGTAIACELGPEFVRVVLNSAPNATPPPPTPPTPPPPPPPTSPPLPPALHLPTTAARTARGRGARGGGSVTLAAAGGCTRGVREKGYTAASRRNGTEALARSRCRSGRCREQRPVLSDYLFSGARWLPRPHLLPINGLCIASLCRPHLRP